MARPTLSAAPDRPDTLTPVSQPASPPLSTGSATLTYADAGVDVEAGDRAVELMKAAVARTHGPEVMGGIGGFAGLFDASALTGYRRPLLASSTDGVGTKVAIAQALDRHDTIGWTWSAWSWTTSWSAVLARCS